MTDDVNSDLIKTLSVRMCMQCAISPFSRIIICTCHNHKEPRFWSKCEEALEK